MPLCPLAPTAAAPALWLGLMKIARTPTARLAVGYRLVPRPPSERLGLGPLPTPHVGGPAVAAARLGKATALLTFEHSGKCSPPNQRPLGKGLLLDRLVAGGIVGEALPLANLRLAVERQLPAGLLFDQQA